MAWKKIDEKTSHYQLKDKKGIPYSAYWVSISQHKTKSDINYGLWDVQRGGFDAKSGFRRTYVGKKFKTKSEADAFVNAWKKQVGK